MSTPGGEGYGLVLAFDTDDPEFCRGFEAGDVYQTARRFADGEQIHDAEPETYTATVNVKSAEMMLRIAESHKLAIRIEDCGDDRWMHATFTRTET